MMRTHILIALLALFVTACASKEHISQQEVERQQERQEQFTQREVGPASQFR